MQKKLYKKCIFNNKISYRNRKKDLEDYILVEVGSLITGEIILFTRILFESHGYEDHKRRIQLVNRGLSLLKKPDPDDSANMMLRVVEKDNIWVVIYGDYLTFMRPEEYYSLF